MRPAMSAHVHHAAEGGHGDIHAPRWIAVAAALLALLAASVGLVANLRVTQSSAAKSDAIILTARASDVYTEYDTRSVKEHVYDAVGEIAPDSAHAARLKAVAAHENAAKAPLLARARDLEATSKASMHRAEHLLASHEILEVATTLFEIAIVLVSVSALGGTRLLPIVAGVLTASGLLIALRGFFY